MLTHKKSKPVYKTFYLLAIPLLAIVFLSFRAPVDRVLPDKQFNLLSSVSTRDVAENPGIPSVFPLPEKYKDEITAGYDKKMMHPILKEEMTHKGIDFRAPTGTSVFAAGDGNVIKAEVHEKYGKLIIIQHQEAFTSLYAHLDQIDVKEGDKVKAGQKIGEVGNTGLSTGSHLHYEVRKDGENVNPADYY